MKKQILVAFGIVSLGSALAQSTQTGTGGAAVTADVRFFSVAASNGASREFRSKSDPPLHLWGQQNVA
jgi:hypothetical protein